MATPQEEQSAILRLQAQGLTRAQAESIVNPTYAPNFSPIEPTSYGNQIPGQAAVTTDYTIGADQNVLQRGVIGQNVPGVAAITNDYNPAPNFQPSNFGNEIPGQAAITNDYNIGPSLRTADFGNRVPGDTAIGQDYNQAPDFTPVSVAGNKVPGEAAITNDYNQGPDFTPVPVDPDSKQGEPGGYDPELFKQQANIRDIEATADDWRFRIRLAPRSQHLYKSGTPGILAPLAETDGVIFPYTPQVMVNYQADYSQAQPTHSNYKQYFYQGSQISDIQITGQFTAQSTREADYLLAAIHFFRSATKMFYGEDYNAGAPPPLVFLHGFGENQFSDMPCVIQQFNYILPPDVDYVRTSGDSGAATLDLSEKRIGPGAYKSPLARLFDLFTQGIGKGGGPQQTQYGNIGSLSNGKQSYVPTKIDIALTLHPIVTRKKQSQDFGLERYASGELLSKKGFW